VLIRNLRGGSKILENIEAKPMILIKHVAFCIKIKNGKEPQSLEYLNDSFIAASITFK
jgi:hypothetical protein